MNSASFGYKCQITFSQPSGGSRAKKRLICGDVPNLEPSWSGDEHTLPPGIDNIYMKHKLQQISTKMWKPEIIILLSKFKEMKTTFSFILSTAILCIFYRTEMIPVKANKQRIL